MRFKKKENTRTNDKEVRNFIICSSFGNTVDLCCSILRESISDKFQVDEIYTFFYGDDAMFQARTRIYEASYLIIDQALDGFEGCDATIEKIKSYFPEIKVIKLCTIINEEINNQVQNGFIDGFVLQPFQSAHLINALDSVDKNSDNEFYL